MNQIRAEKLVKRARKETEMAEHKELEVGDVVRLKSGGPAMTVGSVESDGYCFCHWFEDKEAKMARLPNAALQPTEPQKGCIVA